MKAHSYLERGAQLGNITAKVHLAHMHLEGSHPSASKQTAFTLFREISSHRLPAVHLNLSTCYRLGWGTPVNLNLYQHWLLKATEGDVEKDLQGHYVYLAKLELAQRYSDGLYGIKVNYTEAREIFSTSPALLPHHQAWYGYLLAQGLGGRQDEKGGLKLLQESYEQGAVLASFLLSQYYTDIARKITPPKKEDLAIAMGWIGMTDRHKDKKYLEEDHRVALEKMLVWVKGFVKHVHNGSDGNDMILF